MQQIVVLLVLALVWAAVLVPQHVRNRAESRPADSIGAFQKQLSVLERTSPGSMARERLRVAPHTPSTPGGHRSLGERAALAPSSSAKVMARKRRKDILCGLLAAMAGSLALGFLPGFGVMLSLHLVLDVLFVAYVAMLVRLRNLAEEREVKVRYLPNTYLPNNVRRASEPALLLHRSGS